ncbi:hypothetical protein [Streptomyces sp. NPDC058268]|uniref:hypothetical protein n=1 Tax=Streptomyces sp. NPDC058268 TaxID=3346413 RepID=UPI0036E78D16
MNTEQRSAAAEVIGQAIGTEHLRGYKADFIGTLWLRDVEMAAWQVLHAYRGGRIWEDQQDFVHVWKRS